jgi:polar amino acid transport system substrate-binding protein
MTCDRWQREAFSTEYFRDGQRIMVRADSAVREVEDFVGQRVCVARGTTTIDHLARFPGLVVVPIDDAAFCQVLFERDEVDAVTSNDVILRGYAASDPSARIVGRDLSSDPRGLAFRPGEVDLVRFVNAVLARLREDGSLAAILRRHVPGVDLAHVLRPAVYGRQP